jgi:CRISPR/Cas system CSM-associated protein Csm2 small subunit
MTLPVALPLTPFEARELTDRIRGAAVQMHDLLMEAYARGAWKALGYESWREYATHELSISQSRAYRLLDQASVIAAITEAAGGDISQVGKISALAAGEIKPHLPQVTESIRDAVAAGAEPSAAVQSAVAQARASQRSAAFDDDPEPTPPAATARHVMAAEPEPEAGREQTVADVLEEQEARIAELEALVVSLSKGDLAAEVKRQAQEMGQLRGRISQMMTTANEQDKTLRYQAKLLQDIRKALGVEKSSQILPAITAMPAVAA